MYTIQYRAPVIQPYNREAAVNYAHQWALKYNPKYFDFNIYGGDCTNFASQVIYAGSGAMNYTPVNGWYYINSYERTASWTGVDFLYEFLVNNKETGPFSELIDAKDAKLGDIVQLSFDGAKNFQHSLVIVQTGSPAAVDNILIASHTDDRDFYQLNNYTCSNIRYLHIAGVRK